MVELIEVNPNVLIKRTKLLKRESNVLLLRFQLEMAPNEEKIFTMFGYPKLLIELYEGKKIDSLIYWLTQWYPFNNYFIRIYILML